MKKSKMRIAVKSDIPFHHRRKFLKLGGMALAGAGVMIACDKDDDDMVTPEPGVFDLGEGDLGVLNYAYALEQLEADFYTKVVNSLYNNISDREREIFTDLYNHEVNHREFFKAAIMAAVNGDTTKVLPDLEFDYGNLDFSSRDAVLGLAKTLEDTGVAAYNGAGALISDPNYLLIAGKIVSVEARHASAIRSLINPESSDFAGDDIIDGNGLDLAMDPSDVLSTIGSAGLIKTEFTASSLP